jgi:hypothetical protein
VHNNDLVNYSEQELVKFIAVVEAYDVQAVSVKWANTDSSAMIAEIWEEILISSAVSLGYQDGLVLAQTQKGR